MSFTVVFSLLVLKKIFFFYIFYIADYAKPQTQYILVIHLYKAESPFYIPT
jgi:hypothetical protein